MARRRIQDGLAVLEVEVPSPSMSGIHARLVRAHGKWWLEDRGSRNGTYVDGVRVSSIELGDRVQIELGRTFFCFRSSIATPAHLAADTDAEQLRSLERGLASLVPAATWEFESLHRVAKADVPVLLLGETGTGKELLARAVHKLSGRPGPFVAVNCAALTQTLVESQLFGHKKGAFSGAVRDEPGFVRSARSGTLFLDEIGDLPEAAQAALLRVLEEKEVVPVGSTTPVPVDVRIVSATHKKIDNLNSPGVFRTDLLARIAGYTHRLPSLRDRLEDLGLLASAILREDPLANSRTLTFSSSYALALLQHAWPMNVRELRQLIHTSLVLARDSMLDVAYLPEAMRTVEGRSRTPSRAPGTEAPPPVGHATGPQEKKAPMRKGAPSRDELLEVLERFDYVASQVASALGISRTTLDKWMKDLGIRRPKDVDDAAILEAYQRSGSDTRAAAAALGISERGLRLRLAGRKNGVP